MSEEELVAGEDVLGTFVTVLEKGSPEELAELGDDGARASLLADMKTVGLLGSVAAIAGFDPIDATVREEAPAAVLEELAKALQRPGGPPPPDGLVPRLEAYAASKPARGRDLARRLVGRSIFDLYDLTANGLAQEDLLRAADLITRARAGGDARVFAQRVARLSRNAAQYVLGHIADQLVLIHRIKVEDVQPQEIDAAISEYAPRVLAVRLPSILRELLPQEPRLRLSFVLWGRLRGISLGRQALSGALEAIAREKPITFLKALNAPEARERLRALAAQERGPDVARAREIEDALQDI